MKKVYPQSFKEAIIFSVPNAMTMVLGMVTLNLWIYGALTPGHFLRVVPMMFVVAFGLDFFIVGPLVQKFVMRHNISRWMPVFRVGLMAGILTFLAPIVEAGRIVSVNQYLTAMPRNYIVALVLQVFIAMRIGMYVFAKYKGMVSPK